MATKLTEAAMALLQATPERQMNIVVLNKALFYLDLGMLRDHGRTVTGEKYFALPMGPVVNKYEKRLVRDLERLGWAEQLELGKAKPMRALVTIDFDMLGKVELRLATKIAEFATDHSSATISEYAHKNPGWMAAFKRFTTGRPAPQIDMALAMQQVLEADPWLDEPLDKDTKALVESAKDSRLYDW